jgi:hypothetical protein
VVRAVNESGAAPFLLHLRKQIRDLIKKNRILVGWQSPKTTGEPAPTTSRQPDFEMQLAALKEVFGDRLMLLFNSYPTNLGRSDRSPLDQDILQAIGNQRIPVVDLFADYQQAFKEFRPPFGFNNSLLGQGHLNEHGHALVAEALVSYLETTNDLLQP